jgi:FeS assembly SUF system protein
MHWRQPWSARTNSSPDRQGVNRVMEEKPTERDVMEIEPDSTPRAAPSAAAPASVAQGGTPVEGSALSAEELEQLTADIVAALKTVYDPEIPADIYELGLIYKIDIDDNRHVSIEMTLTAPGCPVAGEMPQWVENAVSAVPGVSGATVTLTFDPPWDKDRMSDEAKLALNMF